jgi:transcription initiation factor IIE alpha subunit
MKKSKKLKLATYNCNLIIIITDKLKAEVEAVYKRLKHKDSLEGEAEGVLITLDIDNYYLIFDTQYLSHNTIAHEIYHAVVKITEDRGIVEEEAQAWLMGYLTGEVYKYIEKNSFGIIKEK